MDSKDYLISKINERLLAAKRKKAEIAAHNKRFATEVINLTSAIQQNLGGVPAVNVVREPMVITDTNPFAKLSISLFDKSVTLIAIEQEQKLALQLDSAGYKTVIFQLDEGLWISKEPGLKDLHLTNDLIHDRLVRIVELEK